MMRGKMRQYFINLLTVYHFDNLIPYVEIKVLITGHLLFSAYAMQIRMLKIHWVPGVQS